jgi:hypothetical protein
MKANSQNTLFGLTVGVNSAKGLRSNSGFQYADNSGYHSGTGFSVGVFAEVPLKHNFYFQPSLSFINKHTSNSFPFSTTSTVASIGELNLNYLYHPFKKSGFLFGGGPSFSIGSYSGKYNEIDINFNYTKTTTNINLIYGVNILAKYEFNHHVAIACNYNVDLQVTNRSQYFGCNIQYSF